jgi:hypothetical protein
MTAVVCFQRLKCIKVQVTTQAFVSNRVSSLSPSTVIDMAVTKYSWLLCGSCDFFASIQKKHKLDGIFFIL